ncbi:unnamed protein product [Brassicogethes aeneus]|uniref:PNK FHA domain-containing protein n=1 Tax=Brassicogethes aeneus TaxID=1431903 RepID=A0A9P0AYT2_BRAAE|nr:unnamed protein product [Brassicogethes aeneus]
MASTARTCFLKCLKSAKRISLPHGVIISIGRQKEYEIEDVIVSRNQIELKSDCEKCHVDVKPVGRNPSGCNGYALVANKNYSLEHGDIIEVRLTAHEYEIVFEPPPKGLDELPPQPKKMKFDFSIFNVGSKKNSDSNFNLNGQWEEIDGKELLIYTPNNCVSRSVIAGFDIDGTIIKTKSGARFPKDCDDWVFYFQDVQHKLKKLHEDKNKIVFFTNQAGIGKDSQKIKGFKRKIENIVNKLEIPIQVFIATGKTFYRKPLPGSWNVLCDVKNDNIEIDKSKSFFVGDAAGRPKNWAPKRNKDHSCADRLFAINLGLTFYTPEEYFLQSRPVQYVMPEFDPKKLDKMQYPSFAYPKTNVVLMVGGPGSGKSHYCTNILVPNGYVHVNRDKLGTMQKCERHLEECLMKKENVVIDNTNPDKKARQPFINIAKKFGVDCRCVVMLTSVKHCKHNNKFRNLTDKSHDYISEVIINKYQNSFQEPELSEGFSQILHIPFMPTFDNEEQEKLYKMYLLES